MAENTILTLTQMISKPKLNSMKQTKLLSNPENRKNTINGENWEQGAEYEKETRKQQSQYKVANSKPTLMVLKVMIILIF
jgi:hypothetical protein